MFIFSLETLSVIYTLFIMAEINALLFFYDFGNYNLVIMILGEVSQKKEIMENVETVIDVDEKNGKFKKKIFKNEKKNKKEINKN